MKEFVIGDSCPYEAQSSEGSDIYNVKPSILEEEFKSCKGKLLKSYLPSMGLEVYYVFINWVVL